MAPEFSYLQRLAACDFSTYIQRFFPEEKIQKITLDAGCSCPNRDGTMGRGGCTYCNNATFSPSFALQPGSITQQLERGIDFFRHKYPHMRYLAYFQSYTATYGEAEQLIALYEEAARFPGVVGLVIGTRPDCMPEVLLNYFSDLSRRCFVLIEYGIESTLDRSLEYIRRGHSWQCSLETIKATYEAGLPVGAHLILGLPGETRREMLDHALHLNDLPLSLVKLHQLQIVRHTIMAHQYQTNPEQFHLFTAEEYVELCLDFLALLREDIVVDRFVAQSPPSLLIAPQWNIKNYAFMDLLRKKAQLRDREKAV